MTLAAGGTLVVADPPAFPSAFARYRASASVMTVPRLYQVVRTQRTAPVDLSSLRAVMVSGSPLHPDRLAEALDVLGPVVFHGYGQTETSMISMIGPAELAADPEALASVGAPPAASAVRIVGPDGADVPDGEVGELVVRTPGQAAGYWADPVETAAVFVDGWVRTRDLGRRDAQGRLHLVGRARDVVIVNAELVHPGPVEHVLATHPDVAEAYVAGAPSEETGEAVHAFVVPSRGARPDAAALRALVAARLGTAAVPASVTVVDQVPTTPAGKPDRAALLRLALPA
jgi:acyl-coenzyme A synthetase/AMP-(fatty) acid ligase